MKQLAVAFVLITSVAGCGLVSSRDSGKSDFDLGPFGASTPGEADSPGADVLVYDITAPAWIDHSSMYYRLTYRNAANPLPYAQSEWVMSPAALLTQRLRVRLGGSNSDETRRVGAHTPGFYVLRSELVEFEQVFDQPGQSRGVIRLRARLEGEGIWTQKTFTIERPARSANAAGGVTALAECSDELAVAIGEWIVASGFNSRAMESARTVP